MSTMLFTQSYSTAQAPPASGLFLSSWVVGYLTFSRFTVDIFCSFTVRNTALRVSIKDAFEFWKGMT